MGGKLTIEPRPAEAWRAEIDDAVLLALGAPFAWGLDDCALWVADVVRDVTGVDWAAGFRDAYRDHAGATAAMRDAGSPVLIGTVHLLAERHGWPAVEPAQAGAGCIGLVGQGDRGDGPALVIYRDAGQWVGRDERGVGYMPGEFVRHAWRLPGAPAFVSIDAGKRDFPAGLRDIAAHGRRIREWGLAADRLDKLEKSCRR